MGADEGTQLWDCSASKEMACLTMFVMRGGLGTLDVKVQFKGFGHIFVRNDCDSCL